MSKINSAEGFVAFIDILGYKQICHQSKDIQNNVLDFIQAAADKAYNKCMDSFFDDNDNPKDHGGTFTCDDFTKDDFPFEKITPLLISDSLVLSLQFTDKDNWCSTFCDACTFFTFVQKLFMEMFNAGLPPRGAICCGEYHTTKTTMSGLPLVRAHELAESLRLSGIALTLHLENKILDDVFGEQKCLVDLFKDEKSLLIKHKTTTKMWENGKETLFIIPPMGDLKFEIYPYVYSKFTEYGKSIDDERVYHKFENTVAFFAASRKEYEDRMNAAKKWMEDFMSRRQEEPIKRKPKTLAEVLGINKNEQE